MILVIDGYNVLKQLFPGLKNNLDKQKAAFIRQLAFYKRKKVATIQEIIVVFDAGPFSHASRSIKSDIVIMYSGTKSTADAWILSYVENNRNKEILVVTRDREIREACHQMGVDSLGSDEFYRILHDNLIELPSPQATETTIEKYDPIMLDDNEPTPHSLSPEALDILMEQSSIEMADAKPNDNDVRRSRQSPAHNLTKKERRIQAKIKKLS
jgi:predicted RNA-binding protein with PIN domain